ncbi:movement protein [Entoleuca gammaflexivirus 1]|uniref:Genome polyprotein n=1 Tax=Entoleuca gammaflexivirus 1 TaxID=2086641 RepID=A0AAD1EES6_9VIRU|nr:movement protein [Entoleuca gammaflexivirus 1]AZG06254.1 movement protein [Entoleuca gammaflexivirus 1]
MPFFFSDTARAKRHWARRHASTFIKSLHDVPSSQPFSLVPDPEMQRAPVTRGDYTNVHRLISKGRGRLNTITGPTGCGKSTFALLKLLVGHSALIICPSSANQANLLTEFNQRIPDTITRLGLDYISPTVSFCNFLTFQDPCTQLTLCTAQDFVNFVLRFKTFPPCDFLILDEYHLNTPSVIQSRFLLRHCLPKGQTLKTQKIIFVSATPPDEPAPPVRTDGLTIVEMDIPDMLATPTPPLYQLSKYPPYSNNYLLIVADSCGTAHALTERLMAKSESVFCICECPTPESVAHDLTTNTYNHTVIATPATEAGITTPCCYMVNPGLASRTDFSNGVIRRDTFPLGPRQSNQRLGRGGRLGHTVVFTQRSPGESSDSPSAVDLGDAYLLVLALTFGHPSSPEATLATTRFPRLKKVLGSGASLFVETTRPMIALYMHDNAGERYAEFGGSATGFIDDNASDFRLFKWPSGSAYAPFLDLCSDHDLSSLHNPALQKSIADAIVAQDPSLVEGITLESALEAAERDPETYANAIWGALQRLHGRSNLTGESPGHPGISNCTLNYMLGVNGTRAFKVIEQLGARFEVSSEPQGGKYVIHRELFFRDQRVRYNGKPLLGPDNLVSPEKVAAILTPALSPVTATQALLGKPEYTIDLTSLAHLAPTCENRWFRTLF